MRVIEREKRPNMKTAKPWQKQNEHYNSIYKTSALRTPYSFFCWHQCKCVCCMYCSFFNILFGANRACSHFSEKVIIGNDSFFMNEKSNVKHAVHIFLKQRDQKMSMCRQIKVSIISKMRKRAKKNKIEPPTREREQQWQCAI